MIVVKLMSNDHYPDTKLTTYVRLKLESLACPFQASGQMRPTVLQMIMSLALDPLSDPMDCSLPGSSVHGIFQARVLEWGVNKSLESDKSSWQPAEKAAVFSCKRHNSCKSEFSYL